MVASIITHRTLCQTFETPMRSPRSDYTFPETEYSRTGFVPGTAILKALRSRWSSPVQTGENDNALRLIGRRVKHHVELILIHVFSSALQIVRPESSLRFRDALSCPAKSPICQWADTAHPSKLKHSSYVPLLICCMVPVAIIIFLKQAR